MKVINKLKTIPKRISKQARQSSILKRKFLEYYAKLPVQKLAAEFIGKSEDTITDWKKADKKFSDQVTSAKSAWALDNVTKVKSKEWLLERIMKDHFAEKKEVEHSTDNRLSEFLDKTSKMLP